VEQRGEAKCGRQRRAGKSKGSEAGVGAVTRATGQRKQLPPVERVNDSWQRPQRGAGVVGEVSANGAGVVASEETGRVVARRGRRSYGFKRARV
jgi:hypothetical protein